MSTTQWADPTVVETRHMRARQEWDLRQGEALVRARNWRFFALVSLFGMLLSIGGIIYLGTKPKSVPYVIEIDQLGDATFRGELGVEAASFRPTDKHVQYQLRHFVQAVRSVSSDAHVTEQLWREAMSMCTGRCGHMLNSYVNDSGGNPMKRMAKENVTVDVVAAVPLSGGDAWQIDWREKNWDSTGRLEREALWRGILHVQIRPPASLDDMRQNPMGLFVDELSWDEVTQ
jgi:type IV secretory pathway TrbF-like protein